MLGERLASLVPFETLKVAAASVLLMPCRPLMVRLPGRASVDITAGRPIFWSETVFAGKGRGVLPGRQGSDGSPRP